MTQRTTFFSIVSREDKIIWERWIPLEKSKHSPYPPEVKYIEAYPKEGSEEEKKPFKAQFNRLLDQLIQWGREEKVDSEKAKSGISRLKDKFFLPQYSGMRSKAYFKMVKQQLEQIFLALKNDQIPLDKRKKAYDALCNGFIVSSAEELSRHIRKIYFAFYLNLSLPSLLTELRTYIIVSYINKYKRKNNIPQDSNHALNAFLAYAEKHNWHTSLTVEKNPNLLEKDSKITAKDFDDFREDFLSKYNSSRVRAHLQSRINSIVGDIFKKFGFKIGEWNNKENGKKYEQCIEEIKIILERLEVSTDPKDFFGFNEASTQFCLNDNFIVESLINRITDIPPYLTWHKHTGRYYIIIPPFWLNPNTPMLSSPQEYKLAVRNFNFLLWDEVVSDINFPSLLIRLINLMSITHINILLERLSAEKLRKMAADESYTRVMAKIENEEKRQAVIDKISKILVLPEEKGSIKLNYNFLQAVIRNDIPELKRLIEEKAHPDTARTIDGESALFIASEEGNQEMVDILLDAKANPNAARASDGATPCALINTDDAKMVDALLRAKANPVEIQKRKTTLLFFDSIMKGNTVEVKKMLEMKVDPNAERTSRGETALYLSVINKDDEMLKILLDANADPNPISKIYDQQIHYVNLLSMAAASGSHEIAKALIKGRAALETRCSNGSTALINAVVAHDVEMLNILIDAKAEVNVVTGPCRRTPLQLAFAEEKIHTGIINALINAKADPNVEMNIGDSDKQKEILTPLMLAVLNKNYEVIRNLITAKANINFVGAGGTPLHLATRRADYDAVRILLEAKADASIINQHGESVFLTALNTARATKQINAEIVSALIDAKADVNEESIAGLGITMLHIAVIHGEDKLVKKLIDAKARVNNAMSNRATLLFPLFIAAQNGNLEMVKVLLEAKANPNPQAKMYGIGSLFGLAVKGSQSPLFAAVNKGGRDIASVLLEANADPNIYTEEGETPFDIAMKKSDGDLAAVILIASAMQRKPK